MLPGSLNSTQRLFRSASGEGPKDVDSIRFTKRQSHTYLTCRYLACRRWSPARHIWHLFLGKHNYSGTSYPRMITQV